MAGIRYTDDTNFQTAVNLWFDNQAEANATYGHISDWNTSAVTDMKNAFFFRKSFNEDISSWDTSSVTDMYRMFNGANAFNQPIGNWDVSSVQRMESVFVGHLLSINQLQTGMFLQLQTCLICFGMPKPSTKTSETGMFHQSVK